MHAIARSSDTFVPHHFPARAPASWTGRDSSPPPIRPGTRTPSSTAPEDDRLSSSAPHHAPNNNANLLPLRPEHHFLCCRLLLSPPTFPRSSSHLRLKKTTTRTPDCHGKHEALLTSSPRNPQLSSPAKHRLKAPTFPQRTDGKRRNKHGLIQGAGFPTADGANTRRNRGTPPAPSSSDHEAAAGHSSPSFSPTNSLHRETTAARRLKSPMHARGPPDQAPRPKLQIGRAHV